MNRVLDIICIVCPKGCSIRVYEDDKGIKMTGQGCQRGYDFALEEVTHPVRTLQTTVETVYDHMPRLSVKTDRPIDKIKIQEVMDVCHHSLVKYMVSTGDIIIENICDTGANLVATTDIS